jgi:hypothetical protein
VAFFTSAALFRFLHLKRSLTMAIHLLGRSPARLLRFGAVLTALLLLYIYIQPSALANFTIASRTRASCPPDAYAAGRWVPRTLNSTRTQLEKADDVLELAGFQGCAADREYYWHLGADAPDRWDRFPRTMQWEWAPGRGCAGVRALDPAALVTDLVENGGWLLIGGARAVPARTHTAPRADPPAPQTR